MGAGFEWKPIKTRRGCMSLNFETNLHGCGKLLVWLEVSRHHLIEQQGLVHDLFCTKKTQVLVNVRFHYTNNPDTARACGVQLGPDQQIMK